MVKLHRRVRRGCAKQVRQGPVIFGGLNKPREVFSAEVTVDVLGFADNPLGTLLPYLNDIQADR